ncbi:Uncharacterised protein [Mycobacteroides abscessus subsp. abscessus]|nr:Uncharacterised protein [Mycobacteroides abscessus subsp. abscessus]
MISRPIDADGTCRYSTGSPGREKAPATGVSAVPPTMHATPGKTATAVAATAIRRAD